MGLKKDLNKNPISDELAMLIERKLSENKAILKIIKRMERCDTEKEPHIPKNDSVDNHQ